MRWLSLILAAAGAAAAARILLNRRSESPAGTTTAPPAPPTTTAAPAPPAPAAQPTPAADERPGAVVSPEPSTEPEATPRSAVSPAAETVREIQGDLLSGLREEPPDDEVEREVEAHLEASPLPADEVSVEVVDRVAQLDGTVPDPQTAMLIGDEAARVDGVKGLENRLRPERERPAEDSGTPRDAEAARDPEESRREAD